MDVIRDIDVGCCYIEFGSEEKCGLLLLVLIVIKEQ
jgi:hypothetical protein